MLTPTRLLVVSMFAWPGLAAAEVECDKYSDCGKNATCVKRSGSSENPGKSSTCEPIPPELIGSHQAPCDVNADCREGLVCATFELKCLQIRVTCLTDVDCPEPPEPECNTVIERRCHYPWQLVCDSDADCGTGFTCEPCPCTETKTQACYCTSPEDGYCAAKPGMCATDADCGPGLGCDETNGACTPIGFMILGQNGVAERGTETTPSASSTSDTSGGCTVNPIGKASWAIWLSAISILRARRLRRR